MKSIILILALNLLSLSSAQINWQSGNWAFGCDFYGNDLQNIKIRGEDCGGTCASTNGCTHFTWTTYNGGTCYMKKGQVSKSDARYTGDSSMVCGIIIESTVVDGSTSRPVTAVPPVTAPVDPSQWPGCQFKVGRDWKGDDADYSGFDYMTFWIGAPAEGCVNSPECTDFNEYWEGAMLKKAKELNMPVILYGYIIAFEGRNKDGLRDCNDGYPNLCQKGANFIRNNRQLIISRYEMHSRKIAEILGQSQTTVFLIEPDFHQYYGDYRQENGPLSGPEMRSLFDDIVKAIKQNLPNAKISWDISPWISDYDMRKWWGYFQGAQIDFINTSGGGNHADSQTIQQGHGLTWAFMSQLTGKKIIADSGYGVVGNPDDNSGPWYNPYHLDNRVRDGVIANSVAYASQKPNYRPNLC